MNQLIRGAGCFPRASRQAFSTVKSASSVGAQNFTHNPKWHVESGYPVASTPTTIGSGRFHRLLPNDVFALNRNLSSLAADTVQSDDSQDESSATTERSPSALELANLQEVTPGQCIFVLQNYAAKGTGKLIRQSDFITLCESSRPGKKRDAKVISTALREFKVNNRFVLTLEGSRTAVEGMLRSMTPTWKVQDGKPRVQAALFVLEQIVNEDTGLYFAIETLMVDEVMDELHKGLIEMEENGFKLKLDNVGDEAESEEEPSDAEKMLKDSLRLTEGAVKLLIKRKSRPEWEMKKRAKRKYLKRLQIGSGPFRSTMQVATKISIMLGGSAMAQEKIVSPFTDLRSTNFIDSTTLKLIEEAKELEDKIAAEAAAAEAAAAAEETEGEDTEDESSTDEDASSTADSGAGYEEESDSQTEDESDEEKKD